MDQETAVDLYEPPTSEDSQHQPLTVAALEGELHNYPATMRVVVMGGGPRDHGQLWEAEAVEFTDVRNGGERVLLIKAY